MKRLFFGIALGEAQTAAEGVLERVRIDAAHQAVRWVKAEKLHLTLVFLGLVDEQRIPEVLAACRPILSATPPFRLGLTELGGFPGLRRPRVVWLGVADSAPLAELQSGLANALSRFAEVEDRPYHVTLGRVSPGSPAVGRMVQSISDAVGALEAEWEVREVILYESAPDGRYLPLERMPLSR